MINASQRADFLRDYDWASETWGLEGQTPQAVI